MTWINDEKLNNSRWIFQFQSSNGEAHREKAVENSTKSIINPGNIDIILRLI